MQSQSLYGNWIIALTLFLSLILTVVPLPVELENYRPEWVLLVLIYWAMYAPNRVGIGIGWVVGLLLDALQGTLLGEYALVGALTTFIVNQFHQRLQLFPILQQCLFIFLLLGIQFIMIMWIQGFSGHPIQGWQYGLPVIVSALIWPLFRGFMFLLRV